MTFKGAMKLTEKENVATNLEEADPGSEVEVRFGDEVDRIKALETIKHQDPMHVYMRDPIF